MKYFVFESFFLITIVTFQYFVSFAQQINDIGENSEELCFCRSPGTRPAPQTVQIQQGRPGKLGPIGAAGPKGDRGPPGVCGCDSNEIDLLNTKIERLSELVNTLASTITQPPETTETQKQTTAARDIQYHVDNCSVGMKYGDSRVRNESITASTYYAGPGYLPHNGRLGRKDHKGFWVPSARTTGDWLQVDLQEPKSVTGVITAGRNRNRQWVDGYKIMFSNFSRNFQTYVNDNGEEVVFSQPTVEQTLHFFHHPIIARYFRLVIESFQDYPLLQMDYITC